MLTCPKCDHDNRDGVLVCEQCGQPLNDSIMLATRKVASGPDSDTASEVTDIDPKDQEFGKYTIQVEGTDDPIVVNADYQIVLGRVGIHTVRRPDVDLSTHSAFRKGVSSLHATIYRIERDTYIADMGSLNGTYLNREGLTPHLRYRLYSGDLIHLGELGMRIFF